ncbi:glycosyltransferase [Chlamydiota bacterium]
MITTLSELKENNVALVHDWLNGMRGGERCLEVICEWFPKAPIYTLLYDKDKLSGLINTKEVISSKIQKYPFWRKSYRYYLPFFPGAIEGFDFSRYDLVVSTSHCVAKSAITSLDTCHICYCFTPMRYVWGFYREYFENNKFHLLKSLFLKRYICKLREWDRLTASRVDYFAAISKNVAERIKLFYKREAEVIYPPCDTTFFSYDQKVEKQDFYLIVSALVPYKRIDLAIQAFNKSGKKLKIIGGGTELEKLRKLANGTIEFLGWLPDETVRSYYRKARAIVFPGKEDLGLVPIEAQACGTPVIAYGQGGVLETVEEHVAGVFFNGQDSSSLNEAVVRFEQLNFNPEKLRENAEKFSKENFEKHLKHFIIRKYNHFNEKKYSLPKSKKKA